MSVNSYRKGCHLLNHDDVIGTRRVSYILYMPIGFNNNRLWENEWGGALELYPVHTEGNTLQPNVAPSVVIPPSWNQVRIVFAAPLYSLILSPSSFSLRYSLVTASIRWRKL